MAEDVTRFRLSVLRESFQHTRATLALVWSASPRMTMVLAALTLVSAVVPLAVAYVGKEIIDAVVARDGVRTLRWVLIELGARGAAGAGACAGSGWSAQLLGARLGLDINVADPREGARARAAPLRGPRVLRPADPRAARGLVAAALGGDARRSSSSRTCITLAGYAALLVAVQRLGGARA